MRNHSEMSETHDNHVSEARQLLASRVEEMSALLAATHEETDADILDGYEDAYDYGLAWNKYLTNHIDETVTYIHLLSTGGPGDEFHVTFGPNGEVENVTYVYLPWFDRVEIDVDEWINSTVRDFYATFYADLVTENN
jgi:hypothetical protein